MKNFIIQVIEEQDARHPLLKYDESDTIDEGDNASIKTLDSDIDCYEETDSFQIGEPRIGERFMVDETKSKFDSKICRACNTLQCRRKDSSNVILLEERRDDLSSRILSKKRKRLDLLSNSGEFRTSVDTVEEEIRVLSVELTRIHEQLKLEAVDRELHDTFNHDSKCFVVHSLHGYESLMYRQDAIVALKAEHDRLVATLASKEIIENILEQ